MKNLLTTLDIGHGSIGWSVWDRSTKTLEGTGSLIFRPDDCLNQKRANMRRMRKNIAARRNRIKRLVNLLCEISPLRREQLEGEQGTGHPRPWLLAARVLENPDNKLTWMELWHVLRWYAHNRGYDGNVLWSSGEDRDKDDDTEKEENAKAMMQQFGKSTMAETMAAFLYQDAAPEQRDFTNEKHYLQTYFKGQNTAFPRKTVTEEVERILDAHDEDFPGGLKGVTPSLIEGLCHDWTAIPEDIRNAAKIRLPKRFMGGLLFGQHIPRFDNRIIPECLITGDKVPQKHCREFYRFRWASLLQNIRVETADGKSTRPLTLEEKQQVNAVMEAEGIMGGAAKKTSIKNCKVLKQVVEEITRANASPMDKQFFTDEMDEALVLDPVKAELRKEPLASIWQTIPDKWQRRLYNQLWKGKKWRDAKDRPHLPSLAHWRTQMEDDGADLTDFDAACQAAYQEQRKAYIKKNKKKPDAPEPKPIEDFLNSSITLSKAKTGRARYSRKMLQKAYEQILYEDIDPRAQADPVSGKAQGCLCETKEVRDAMLDRDIDRLTNNHLVRHRMKMLERLFADIIEHYGEGQVGSIREVVVETARDMVEYSGMSNKEKQKLFGSKTQHHKKVSESLEKLRKEEGRDFQITAGLIRKVRIAEDMNYTCPFTTKKYSLDNILSGEMELEHIIPYSQRPSNSLESLVLTWQSVNRHKGKRTAMRYIIEEAGKPVPGASALSIQTPKNYQSFVEKLKAPTGADDDRKRCSKRRVLMLRELYDERDADFLNRDLTQTSYLNKLAQRQIRHYFKGAKAKEPKFTLIPGSVTAQVRKAWKVHECLATVNPLTLQEDGTIKPKGDLRDVTHLHHAVDATTLGIVSLLFKPGEQNTRLWELISKRSLSEREKDELDQLNLFSFSQKLSERTDNVRWQAHLKELEACDAHIMPNIREKLAEKRVVMHLPQSYSGLRVEETTWRVHGPDESGKKMVISQYTRDEKTGKRSKKVSSEFPSRMLGYVPGSPGKLSKLKGTVIVKENYGLALEPKPKVLRYLNVWSQIQCLKDENHGIAPRIIRNGQLVHIPRGKDKYLGIWRIRSIKDTANGIMLQLSRPDSVATETGNILLKTLIKDGLTPLCNNMIGSNC